MQVNWSRLGRNLEDAEWEDAFLTNLVVESDSDFHRAGITSEGNLAIQNETMT